MSHCHSCGKAVQESEAVAQKIVGKETFLFCCRMCLSAFDAGHVARKLIMQAFSDHRATILIEYLPALQIGGDYACIRSVGEDKLYIVVADVAGHDLGSSLVMSRLGGEIERLIQAGEDLGRIGESLNALILSTFGAGGPYLTLFGSEISFSAGKMTYINCGHPTQLLWSEEDRKVTRLESQNLPVGLFGSETFGSVHKNEVKICAGDKLMFFTDGLLDFESDNGSVLGDAGLLEMFHKLIVTPTEQAKRRAIEKLRATQKGPLNDDLLMVFVDLKRYPKDH